MFHAMSSEWHNRSQRVWGRKLPEDCYGIQEKERFIHETTRRDTKEEGTPSAKLSTCACAHRRLAVSQSTCTGRKLFFVLLRVTSWKPFLKFISAGGNQKSPRDAR
jgi:hypothetical protein